MSVRRVLIAEDQVVFSQLLEKWLTGAGLEVRRVENGEVAVTEAKAWLPDLVLMDLRMPVVDGFEAARRIRADPATCRIPIIATTSLEHPDDVLRALSSGFNKYLRKPFEASRILGEIEEVLFFAERRQRIAALAPRVLRVSGLATVGGEQRQIMQELLRAVQRLVPCDILALGWRRAQASGFVVVADAITIAPEVIEAVSTLAWQGANLKAPPKPLVVTGMADAPPAGQGLAVWDVQTMLFDGERVGALVVGRFQGNAFSPEDQRALAELSPLVARTCQVCSLEPGADVPIERVVQDMNAVLISDSVTAAREAEALERAVDGLKVSVLPALDALVDVSEDVHLAIVAAHLFGGVYKQQMARQKAGRPRLPAVKLEPLLLSTPGQLAAWLLMSVLIGLMDGGRSGTLHVLRRGGGLSGLLVFKGGRLAWGTAEGTQADLLRVLESQTGAGRERLLTVVKRCQQEGWSLSTGLEREGLADRILYERAIKTYLSLLTGELLREVSPVVYWSQLVSVGEDCPTFDVGEIAMSGMVP